MPTPVEITTHHEAMLGENPWVSGTPPKDDIELSAYDPKWPVLFDKLARDIRVAFQEAALRIDHIGSTSVPGLAAKPVIDIDLILADPTDEDSYVPKLRTLGYELLIREPSWHQHRCLRLDEPRVNLHIFGPDCPENIRHRLFRDWLREHPEDRELYENAKQEALLGVSDVRAYNSRKQPVIRIIYAKVFRAAGLV